jgi:predicted MFS family arabinose efflux permease
MTRSGLAGNPFRLVLAATVLGFGGYALLLPVVPLWVARGGSGELGAGATTGVLMVVTVATQLVVPWLLHTAGHRVVLAAGMVLLGAPTPLLALSAELAPVLAVSAARGVGFGLLTVAGSALVAELVTPSEHGRASARYGLAVGLPQLALLPAGVAVVDAVGFTAVFAAAGAAPMLGVLLVPAIRMVCPELAVAGPSRAGPAPAPSQRGHSAAAGQRGLRRRGAGPMIAMAGCSVAQGGLITFLPLAAPAPTVAAALFATAAGTLAGRMLAGELVDRWGLGGRLLVPGMLLAAAGMAAEVLAVVGGAGWPAVAGAAMVGLGFGVVQNDALTSLFAAAGPARYGTASAAWNIAYDAGTGLGAVGLGAVAEPFGFAAAFAVSGLALLLAAPSVSPGGRSGTGPPRRCGTGTAPD